MIFFPFWFFEMVFHLMAMNWSGEKRYALIIRFFFCCSRRPVSQDWCWTLIELLFFLLPFYYFFFFLPGWYKVYLFFFCYCCESFKPIHRYSLLGRLIWQRWAFLKQRQPRVLRLITSLSLESIINQAKISKYLVILILSKIHLKNNFINESFQLETKMMSINHFVVHQQLFSSIVKSLLSN